MKKIVVIIISVIFIPFIITSFFYEYKLQHIQSGFNSNKDETVVRVLTKNNTVEKINLEDYLVGVVSGEVPVSFEKEAIKAQAVAARTYALKQIERFDILSANGIIICESAVEDRFSHGFAVVRVRRYGATMITILQRQSGETE